MLNIHSGFMVAMGKEVGYHRSVHDLEVSRYVPQGSAGFLHGHKEFKVLVGSWVQSNLSFCVCVCCTPNRKLVGREFVVVNSSFVVAPWA